MSALEAVLARRSWPRVSPLAPDREEVARLLEAAGGVADHAALRPWRVIEVRGDARARLGDALGQAAAEAGADGQAQAAKPLRASLLLALVASPQPSPKVPEWEQDAVAAGVGHVLSLLLDEAGWGVMWRTGPYTRSEPVRRFHALGEREHVLGWLYVGGVPDGIREPRPRSLSGGERLTTID